MGFGTNCVGRAKGANQAMLTDLSRFPHVVEDTWYFIEDMVCRRRSSPDSRLDAFAAGGGCSQRVRSQSPSQSGYYDLPHYRRVLEHVVSECGPNPLACDLGCGDGRGVRMLLEAGLARIVVQDFNVADLKSLLEGLDIGERERVLPVCASVLEDPIFPGAADVALMFEVAYTLDDPLRAYRHCASWLRPGGWAIVSNVAPEAYFVHALLNDDFEQAERVACERHYVDRIAGTGEQVLNVALYDQPRMVADAGALGLEVVHSETIHGAAALMIHALRRTGALGPEATELLREVDQGGIEIPRLHVSILRKT